MKKISSIIVLLFFIFIGIGGCTKQTTEQEGKENEQSMLTYLNEKYDTEFTTVEYIPAKRGFNDSMNQNILVAESEDGLRVEVRETVRNPGEYTDTYMNAYAAMLISNEFNYNSISNLQFAKTYINLRSREVSLEDLQMEKFSITNDMVINFSSIISISGNVSEEALVELYDVYTEQVALGYKRNVFVASFGGDLVKSEKYVNSYTIYGIRNWEVYDESVKAVIVVTDNDLSYEEFRHRVIYR